jgi:8-oxo-dGTP pyrophosphatase MutT (NUDIX family)
MIESAHAVLLLNDRYVLQLRDDIPTISAAGQWSLFGGRIEAGEDPAETVSREVREELSLSIPAFSPLWSLLHYAEFEQAVIRMWFFKARVDELWSAHRLKEGQAVAAFTFEQVISLDMPPVIRDVLRRHYYGKND